MEQVNLNHSIQDDPNEEWFEYRLQGIFQIGLSIAFIGKDLENVWRPI